LNKKRLAEPVHRGGFMDAEAEARAVNAEPWEPLPGMVKQRCEGCRYLFATPADCEAPRCPDCVAAGRWSRSLPPAGDPA